MEERGRGGVLIQGAYFKFWLIEVVLIRIGHLGKVHLI